MSIRDYTVIIGISMLCNNCSSQSNPKLMTPDRNGGGHNLTPLGCLVFGPWQTYPDGLNNVAVFLDGKEISSVGMDYSPLQLNLVFELLQDGTVKYWFRSDYDSGMMVRMSPDSNGVQVTTNQPPGENEIKKVYHSGVWRADFRDSTLTVEFGKDGPSVPALIGRYKDLGSDLLGFQQISYFDSTALAVKKTYKRVITTLYHHPWINKF
jgi:hypothetical protein